jgi:hypothetical protein
MRHCPMFIHFSMENYIIANHNSGANPNHGRTGFRRGIDFGELL